MAMFEHHRAKRDAQFAAKAAEDRRRLDEALAPYEVTQQRVSIRPRAGRGDRPLRLRQRSRPGG